MSGRNIRLLIFILILLGFALWAILPLDSERLGRKGLRLGLDLVGGTQLVYMADLSKKAPTQTDEEAMAGVRDKIERRVNAYGVTEPIIQIQGGNQILVQLPGIRNLDEAVQLIGQTAQLDFREIKYDEQGEPVYDEEGNAVWIPATATGSDGVEKELLGKYFKPNAAVVLDPQTNEPQVSFEWTSEGAELFEQITKRNLQRPLGIFLDNELISSPIVQAVIKEQGVITGVDINEARMLAIQLNSGALDVPLHVVQRQDVDATLGADSLRRSLVAGIIGLGFILVFMIIYYRIPGLLASLALVIYGALLLTVFKLIPVTLTLPGVAAFIISVGMAVDANVLIFERMKEELRTGRTFGAAVEAGFDRAWTAIRDSNVATFITCGILYWFGSNFGATMVMGFALTLFIGVALSMFTAITITRTFLRLFIGSRLTARASVFGS